jgi:CRISPR type III-A-associated protein Csm2
MSNGRDRQPYRGGQQQRPHQGGGQPNRELEEYREAIKANSFSDESVMRLAEGLACSLTRGIGAIKKENSRTQVRKFYNQVRVIERQTQQVSPELIRTKLRTLQAQVAYAVARGTITADFKTFFDLSIARIIGGEQENIKQSVDDFVTFFESLYAYFYFHTR